MHEMSLCSETVKLLAEQASIKGYRKVTAVWLEVGAFSCVEPDALRFCFTAAAKGSLVEGAALHIVRPEGKAWCFDCNQQVVVSRQGDGCPVCGSYQLKIAQGDNLRIKEIEVE